MQDLPSRLDVLQDQNYGELMFRLLVGRKLYKIFQQNIKDMILDNYTRGRMIQTLITEAYLPLER